MPSLRVAVLASACLVFGLSALVQLGIARRVVAPTTLLAPWCWALATVAVTTLVGLWQPLEAKGAGAYAAAMVSFTPFVALLGAKRPQDGAWQLVVSTLVVLLALPAGTAWLLYPGTDPAPHVAVRALWVVLLLIAASNYVATRFAWANLLSVLGQATLLVPWLIPTFGWSRFCGPLSALAIWNLALLVARLARRSTDPNDVDRVWIDFRDTFGVVWSLRVMERFNMAARLNRWPIWLTWSGLIRLAEAPEKGTTSVPQIDPQQEPLEGELRAVAEQCLDSVLWRFVSRQSIACRRPPS